MGLSRDIAGGVAILTPMLAAGIYIDAVPMARGKLGLIGKRAIPFKTRGRLTSRRFFFEPWGRK